MIQPIILAAGSAKRFGENKLMVAFLGKPLLHHVMKTVLEAGFNQPILVYYNNHILETTPYPGDITYVYNKHAPEGMSTSVRCGLRHAPLADAYLFINGDQPMISVSLLNQLVEGFLSGQGSIIVPRYNGKRGNPTLFSQKWRGQLMEVSGDKGGRDIICNHPQEVCYMDIDNVYMGKDIDTKEDYDTLKEMMGHEE